MLQTLLRARPWKAILIRYRLTFDVFRRVFTLDSSGEEATLNVDGHTIPAFCLPGQYVADATVLGLRAGQALRPSSQRPSSGRSRGPDASAAFKEIERFVLALGSDVTPLPRRANGSFVFRRRRNFVTLIPSATGLKIDVYIGGSDWHNGVRVTPGGIGVDEAKRLVRRAYELASR